MTMTKKEYKEKCARDYANGQKEIRKLRKARNADINTIRENFKADVNAVKENMEQYNHDLYVRELVNTVKALPKNVYFTAKEISEKMNGALIPSEVGALLSDIFEAAAFSHRSRFGTNAPSLEQLRGDVRQRVRKVPEVFSSQTTGRTKVFYSYVKEYCLTR